MGIEAWRNSLLNWIPSVDLSKPSALELTHILSGNATNSEFAGTNQQMTQKSFTEIFYLALTISNGKIFVISI